MMTKFLSKRTNLCDRIGCEGSNDDQMSFKETNFVKQNWWPNFLQSDQFYEIEVFPKCQMMTKCPSKRPNLWDRSVRIGSNDDQMSFKESKFVKQNWTNRVKWWPNVLQRDQIYEIEVFVFGQMMIKCPSKRSNLLDRIGWKGSNDDQMSFKETNFVKQNWLQWVKWWPNVLQRDQIYEIEVFGFGQMMTKCPSKRSNLLNRIGCDRSNDDQMSFKETKCMR